MVDDFSMTRLPSVFSLTELCISLATQLLGHMTLILGSD